MSRVSEVTLVVVDMQARFPASWNVLEEVQNEIALAARQNASCIVLEYQDCGPTLAGIRHAVSKYRIDCRFVQKSSSDGAAEVSDTCKQNGFSTKKFRVVGVNLHGCVEVTVLGLIRLFPDCLVEVVMEGCSDNFGVNWESFPVCPNISVVSRSPANRMMTAEPSLCAA